VSQQAATVPGISSKLQSLLSKIDEQQAAAGAAAASASAQGGTAKQQQAPQQFHPQQSPNAGGTTLGGASRKPEPVTLPADDADDVKLVDETPEDAKSAVTAAEDDMSEFPISDDIRDRCVFFFFFFRFFFF
jgi:hypothetical protein